MSKITRALNKAKIEREQTKAAAVTSNVESGKPRAESAVREQQPAALSLAPAADTSGSRTPIIHEPTGEAPRYIKKVVYKRQSGFQVPMVAVVSMLLLVAAAIVYAIIYQRDTALPVEPPPMADVASIPSEIPTQEQKQPAQPVERKPVRPVSIVPVATPQPVPSESATRVTQQPAAHTVDPTVEMIASFNSGKRIDELGGNILAFSSADEPFVCRDSFTADHARLGKGYALAMHYNVDAPRTYVENGVRIDTAGIVLDGYEALSFYLKGDMDAGFSSMLVCEMIGEKTQKMYKLSNVTERWEHVVLPLEVMKSENETLREIRIAVRSDIATVKTGVVYLDDVALVKE